MEVSRCWRWFVAAGVALPLISLLFVEDWYPRAGLRNFQRAEIFFWIGEDRVSLGWRWLVLDGVILIAIGFLLRPQTPRQKS
jgi:uncharacterized membrane protein HdeD (DUF308 family)